MPPPLLIDLEPIDLDAVVATKEQIYAALPQRHEFGLLDGVCHLDANAKQIVTFRDCRSDDWWVRGHVPGRPLLPGVLMLEMAAQTSAYLAKQYGQYDSFIAFGGIDECKFRDTILPDTRLYILCVGEKLRSRRIVSRTQGFADGRLIFEAKITGLTMS